ncbi:hypothetical protein ACJMK2_012112 [Sinanodonta woodiana]|uniref:Uncharacterized protein n=2 Tax=Sinanodonta woodiana TaxID=1069815 RepID=A0ABD3V749_SINWO
MKEQTYGWYPSAKDVYKDRRMGVPNAYQMEAMYRFQDSSYYLRPFTPQTVEYKPPGHSPTIPSSRRPASTVTGRSSSRSTVEQQRLDEKESLRIRAKSAPVFNYKRPPKLQLPTPMQCWSTYVPATPITVPPAATAPTPSPTPVRDVPSPSVSLPNSYMPSPELKDHPDRTDNKETPVMPAQKISEENRKRARIMSAKIRRDVPFRPPRPIKSAGPVRPQTKVYQHMHMPDYQLYNTPAPVKDEQIQVPDSVKPSSSKSSEDIRPRNPSPLVHMEEEEYYQRSPSPDYDADLERHGWLMEVHGDPLKLKKVSKRLPYTVKVKDPVIPPEPPKVHMENRETFFLNTIPRRPMTFTIDKEWVSEVIHAKRMELQKREGIKHRWKNFAFVY